MARPRHEDCAGAWWHVTNRGLSKRTLFENKQDVHRFEEILADVSSRNLIEVHALTCIPNHYHMLVRSPAGELSEALRLIGNFYARWFNRSRKRDGSLFPKYGAAHIPSRSV